MREREMGRVVENEVALKLRYEHDKRVEIERIVQEGAIDSLVSFGLSSFLTTHAIPFLSDHFT